MKNLRKQLFKIWKINLNKKSSKLKNRRCPTKYINELSEANCELKEALSHVEKALHSAENKIYTETKQFEQKVEELKALEEVKVRGTEFCDEIEALKEKVSDNLEELDAHNKEILYLNRSNQTQKSINIRLNRELSRLREENYLEKNKVVKDLKVKVKYWRKSLGNERRAKIKLEKKLKAIEIEQLTYKTVETFPLMMDTAIMSTTGSNTMLTSSSNFIKIRSKPNSKASRSALSCHFSSRFNFQL